MPSILITGASTGFGRATALELARRGWQVIATMRDTAKAQSLIDEAGATDVTGSISALRLDVTDPVSVETAVASAAAMTGGTFDAVLCNAGYSILGAFEDYSDADCRSQMETNFFGTLAVARAVFPLMREARRGRMVVISSNAVNTPHPMLSMYAASKWALEGWAEGVAMELAPFGVELCLIQPGAHRTEFAGNVAFVQPDGSAYRQWMETAMPGISNLDAWGRDPRKGADDIVAAICAPAQPFRQPVGEDAKVFAALKGVAPYETRATLVRAAVGLPREGAYTDRQERPTQYPGVKQVLEHIVRNCADLDDAALAVATSFGLAQP